MPEKKRGDMVEGYKVLAELGRGAASIIYLVHDPKTKQVWALKQVEKNDPKDQRFLDQAESEYKVSQELDHTAIRHIEKLIRVKGSILSVRELFLVMELVDGDSAEVSPPDTFEKAVSVFIKTAEGLAHMHERGYVHADMKPNNIIVSDDGRVKIIDLGQSCKVGTVKPRIQGTPDYIAPEQVHRRPITPRTDIYNLGATMYWILTRKYIPTALAKGDSLVGSIDDKLLEKPTPVIDLNPKVHPKLSELVMQCVEPLEDNRPENMQAVIDRLQLVAGILQAQGSGAFPIPAAAQQK
ncbi:MAG: serine/threonine-protein kinase [Phycisphaerales bacterium]|nr:serine/threonine-protein kinase [Phycisphaerales bacterium]